MNTVKEYNDYLINNHIDIELIDYFKNIHSKFYNTVDITFMDYFLEICDKEDEFCINHIKLQEYGVINNLITSANILRTLNQYNLEQGIDFNLFNIEQVRENRGTIFKKEYILTSNAFKLCLIRAKNSKKYANYYLLLEKVFKNSPCEFINH